ncbi:hypothetical protein COW98_00665 [Candidatus Roizmanbacteria bacterium CG22_combo_CG10-13_8_21_14_all_35_9]|uniref:LTD domain-containing protein n=4 Tax=Candidatus Roizmaniibacteriota TaxID=1752723 RepID=A0A2M8F2P3_9BACT|nr:MAG: hypothetical protein COX47_03555 [Candidatus Roizmanbacteria bacterium CG23_combo_of_CG06-09_8_20_14_all_35_49]PIP63062.1 MAG: hypothetical protein COW98_00665 [Candidatus Roizmanbacteria bacterium CG22_combo_CG10-13_8_21_14_all_35_9]PIY71470.1 MAG: hypothetical protein COY88_00105 [Candidatus Roizmanbacteria bacterium CG_4_10_14_0_8_um_filter_35_28]PJC33562.1 MAG: hypothetical protein CO048_02810 [Candidatus Roizmanbacteria bacterium CG_4_9_14_0_2_um_filter_35_15]PJC82570.1 MAG: hypoth
MKKIIVILLFCLFARNAWATTKVTIQDYPLQIYPNQEFSVVFNIINDFISSDGYYVKGRIGSTSANLNKGETYNPTTNNWLSDTSSWDSFPIINFNNDTIATASAKLRVNQTVFIENNLLVIRINKNGKNYDSSSTALLVFEPTPTPTETISLSPTITPIVSFEPTEIPEPTPISYNNIFINEVMVNPESGSNEWVEIYNDNDFSVTLSNWYLDDIENAGSSPKSFSLEIPAKGYRVFNLSSSMFNNDADSVSLLDFNKNTKDSFEYQSSTKEKTFGRTTFDNDDFCLQEPSYEAINNGCLNPIPTVSLTTKPVPTPTLFFSPTTFSPPRPGNVQLINQLYTNDSQVLGAYTENKQIIKSTNNKLVNSFLIISFSYSLLTIVSVSLKIKLSYGKGKKNFSSFLHS